MYDCFCFSCRRWQWHFECAKECRACATGRTAWPPGSIFQLISKIPWQLHGCVEGVCCALLAALVRCREWRRGRPCKKARVTARICTSCFIATGTVEANNPTMSGECTVTVLKPNTALAAHPAQGIYGTAEVIDRTDNARGNKKTQTKHGQNKIRPHSCFQALNSPLNPAPDRQ